MQAATPPAIGGAAVTVLPLLSALAGAPWWLSLALVGALTVVAVAWISSGAWVTVTQIKAGAGAKAPPAPEIPAPIASYLAGFSVPPAANDEPKRLQT